MRPSILFAFCMVGCVTACGDDIRSRRMEARVAVLDFAARKDRFFDTNQPLAEPGRSGCARPIVVGSGYYQVSVCSTAPSALAASTYTVTATPVAGKSQVGDTQCASFSVASSGTQYAFTSAGVNNTAYCWANWWSG
jgi:type IV pilus assembly protein PilE